MDFSAIKALIQQNIRTNNNEDITGNVLQQVLLGMIETLGEGAINDILANVDNIEDAIQDILNGGYGDGVYDISANHGGASYASLSDALGTNGANVPEDLRKGGMSVKFVSSFDNKYVQYRLTSQNFNVITSNWLKDDDVLTRNSEKDFSINDENGYRLVQFEEGHLATKNFNSKTTTEKLNTIEEGAEVNDIDVKDNASETGTLNFTDEEKNIILSLDGGYVKTKNFNSKTTTEKLDTIEEGAEVNDVDVITNRDSNGTLNFTDENRNIILSVEEGHIKTKNFNSENIESNIQKLENYASVLNYKNKSNAKLIDSFQRIGAADLNVVIIYGQSLSNGSETPVAVYDKPIESCLMLGSNITDISSTVLNPMTVCSANSEVREDGIATRTSQNVIQSAVLNLAKAYKTLYPADDTKFVAVSAGAGGKTIAQLSSETRYPTCNDHMFDSAFKVAVDNLKTASDNAGKTIACVGIIYMQGEADMGVGQLTTTQESDLPRVADTNQSCDGSKDGYKTRFEWLKGDMQNYVMSVFGQDEKPLIFVHALGGYFVSNNFMPINEAYREIVAADNDVIQCGPTYCVPDYGNGHLSVNGYRWYGEFVFRAMYLALVHNLKWSCINPTNVELVNNEIQITFDVPVMPLVIDTQLEKQHRHLGFKILAGTEQELLADATVHYSFDIDDVEIVGNKIILSVPSSINLSSYDCVDVSYGNWGSDGAGNIHDSDRFSVIDKYHEDVGDHGFIKSDYWEFVRVATSGDNNIPIWSESSTYQINDLVRIFLIDYNDYVVVKSKQNDNTEPPYNLITYKPENPRGQNIYGYYYPMFNWLNNFYHRITNN